MAFSPQQIADYEEAKRREEEGELRQVEMIVGFARTWTRCERKACRRKQRCADLRLCAKRYEKPILEWQREVLVPYLRERYPMVKWGAPAGEISGQFAAAREAEKDLSEAELLERAGEALARARAKGAW
jgi:hypothetical protein